MKKARKILIVDDNAQNLELATDILEDEGYIVFKAKEGRQGIDLAKKVGPDLILLDWMMPGMSGIEVCQEMRSIKCNTQIRIIMLTAKAHSVEKDRGLASGVNDYMTKPYSSEELLKRVKIQLKLTETQDHSKQKK